MPNAIQATQGLHRKGVHTLKSPARHVCRRREEETRGRKGMRVSKQQRAHRFLLLRALLGLLLLLVPLELRLCLPRHKAQARVIMRVRSAPHAASNRSAYDASLGATQQPPTCVPIWNPLILSLVSCALEPCNEPKHPPVSRSPRRAGQRAPTPDAAEIRARSIALGTDEARAGGEEALQRLPARQPTFWSFLASSPQGSSSGASPMAPRATSELWRNAGQDFLFFWIVTNCMTFDGLSFSKEGLSRGQGS
jgi:hypothetical protein